MTNVRLIQITRTCVDLVEKMAHHVSLTTAAFRIMQHKAALIRGWRGVLVPLLYNNKDK